MNKRHNKTFIESVKANMKDKKTGNINFNFFLMYEKYH